MCVCERERERERERKRERDKERESGGGERERDASEFLRCCCSCVFRIAPFCSRHSICGSFSHSDVDTAIDTDRD